MANDAPLLFVPVGENAARPFGMDARDRACRLATNAGFECADVATADRAALFASLDYAWDPAWLKAMRLRPQTALTLGGKPVLVHPGPKGAVFELTLPGAPSQPGKHRAKAAEPSSSSAE